MLAICSDLDETPNAVTYFEISRFLNTKLQTSIGPGVGLETGNTLYFKMPPDQFSYYNATDEDRQRLHLLIKSGHIDCLHSFGDLVDSREEAIEAWNTLLRHDCHLEVWIDHARAASNFDPDIMFGEGARPGAACYHADLSLKNGIKYVWKGRVTSVIAQNVPISLASVFRLAHPLASCITLCKESLKILFAWFGSAKYAMHGKNQVLRATELESGHKVLEFLRSNPSWGGVSHSETADGISEVVTNKILDQLVKQRGTTVIYTHLGKTQSEKIIPDASVQAFRKLAEYVDAGKILVTTTRRLLGFVHASTTCSWTSQFRNSRLTIILQTNLPASDLQGLCWYIPDEVQEAEIIVNQMQPARLTLNDPDDTGKKSVSIDWLSLSFPE